MSEQDDLQLEKLIKEIFFNAKRKSVTPSKVRLDSIVKRGRYETAFKDAMKLTSQLISAMVVMLSLFLKVFSTNTK